ncbi:MAG: flippase [Patescibacteria group bacterium]
MLEDSLKKIAGGGFIIFIGTLFSLLLQFFYRLIIIRNVSQYEYGLFSLGLVIVSILLTFSLLGLEFGVSRFIGFYRGHQDDQKITSIIASSIKISVISGIFFMLILWASSPLLSSILHDGSLKNIFSIFAISLPFSAFIQVMISVYLGLERVMPKVIINNLQFVLLIIGFYIVRALDLPFMSIIYAYSIAIFFTFLALAFYSKKIFRLARKRTKTKMMTKKLLLFSLPLLGQNLFSALIVWTDTLMLGFFKNPETVGLYNSAIPLAHLIPIMLTSTGFIFIPIFSQLYARGLLDEMRKVYVTITKWLFSSSMIIILFVLLFPGNLISFFYGEGYIAAATALKILAIGFIIHILSGPNGLSLVVIGKTKQLLITSFAGCVLNIILNILFIPRWGIIGAATASTITLIAINIINLSILYYFSKIHILNRRHLLPPILFTVLVVVLYYFFSSIDFSIIYSLVVVIFLFVLYIFLMYLSKSFNQDDNIIISLIESKLKVNLNFLRKVING